MGKPWSFRQGAIRNYSRYFKPRECKVAARFWKGWENKEEGEGNDEKEGGGEDQRSEAEAYYCS